MSFPARFRGFCMLCKRPIEASDPIQPDGTGKFVHVDCGASRAVLMASLTVRHKRNREIANIAYHRVRLSRLARGPVSFTKDIEEGSDYARCKGAVLAGLCQAF
jgi:hypothetical protein